MLKRTHEWMQEIGITTVIMGMVGTSNNLAILSDIKERSSDSNLSDSADSCSLSHQLLKHECIRSTTSQIPVSLHIFHILLPQLFHQNPQGRWEGSCLTLACEPQGQGKMGCSAFTSLSQCCLPAPHPVPPKHIPGSTAL